MVYAAIYLIYTWPLVTQWMTHIPGEVDADVYNYIWDNWQIQLNPLHMLYMETDKLFAPLGIDRTFLHIAVVPMSLFTIPFESQALGFNIYLLLIYVISGIGGFWLCKRFVSNPWLCLIAGAVFAFSPWKMARLEFHYNLIQTAAVPFFILFMLKAFRWEDWSPPKLKNPKFLGLTLLMGFILLISDKVTTVMTGFFVLLFLLWTQWPFLKNFRFSAKNLLIIAGFFLGGHFVIEWLSANFYDKDAFWWGADLLGLLSPWHHLTIANLFPEAYINAGNPRGLESITYLGFTFLGLFVLAFYSGRATKLPLELKAFTGVGATLILLTMPEISFAKESLVNNPLSFFHFIPGIQEFRCPGRFIMLVYLLWVIPAFYLIERIRIRKNILAIAAGLLFFVEYLPADIHTLNISHVPKVYQELKGKKGDILLPVPFGLKDGVSKGGGDFRKSDYLYQQTHEKAIIGGKGPISDEDFAYYQNDTVMHTLLKLQEDTSHQIPDFSRQEFRKFRKRFKPDWVVIRPSHRDHKVKDLIDNIVKGHVKRRDTINDYELIGLEIPPATH